MSTNRKREATESGKITGWKRNRSEQTPRALTTSPQATRIEYGGWRPCPGQKLDRVKIGGISSSSFYEQYVSRRKPCILEGFIGDKEWAVDKWSNAYLISKAGHVAVDVERRSTLEEQFGRGLKTRMPFKKFVDVLSSGDQHHYLTTQDLEVDDEGRPAIMSELMQTLSSDFPIRPKILGKLVPQNINLWMGNSQQGSSSGLHHDFHDNLYILLRGRKRFRLFSPADINYLYMHGTPERVHRNGLINYIGEPTRPDGSDQALYERILAEEAQQEAAREVELAEIALESGEQGAHQRLCVAEKQLEAAMERMLELQNFEDEDYSDESEPEDEERGTPNEIQLDSEKVTCSDKQGMPNHFSRLDFSEPFATLREKFPKVVLASEVTCEVHEGEMLYLPASWFHEVLSVSGVNGHMALNYWVHPPDATPASFESPYSSSLWEKELMAKYPEMDCHPDVV